MTTTAYLSGWCLDADSYRFQGNWGFARKLHASCRTARTCGCSCHRKLSDPPVMLET